MLRLRRRRRQLRQLAEAEVYARSYGERSDEVTNVRPVERVDVEQEKRGEREEQQSRLTDRALRNAFLARLERRRE